MAKSLSVIFVCTGNICRSPSAEGILKYKLRQEGLSKYVHVDSAGTYGYHIGEPPDPRAIEAVSEIGVDISNLRAREIDLADIEEFDWIVAMDTQHKNDLRYEFGRSISDKKVKLLLEFAEKKDFARYNIADMYPLKGVPDPYYGGKSDFKKMVGLIQAGTDGMIRDIKRFLGKTD